MCICVHVFPFFPGQRNHVLNIDIIKFMTHRPRSPSLSHRAYSETSRERERARQRERETFILFSMSLVITPRQDVDGGLVINNWIMKQRWHSGNFVTILFCRYGRSWETMSVLFLLLCLQAVQKNIICAFTCVASYWCANVCVCVLTGAGHGGGVAVSTEESGVAVADSGPISERVAVWRTLRAACI